MTKIKSKIWYLYGNIGNTKQNIFFANEESTSIGRSKSSDIVLRHKFISRNHCYLYLKGNKLSIIDTSSNGVLINNSKMNEDSAPITTGDIMSFREELQFKVQNMECFSNYPILDLTCEFSGEPEAYANEEIISPIITEKAKVTIQTSLLPLQSTISTPTTMTSYQSALKFKCYSTVH